VAFDYTVALSKKYEEFRKRWRKYARVIKELAEAVFKGNLHAVYVFGSTVRGDYRALSDIDVAVVLKEDVHDWIRVRFRSLIRERLGRVHPFEVHLVTREKWVNWYLRFIKEDFTEV